MAGSKSPVAKFPAFKFAHAFNDVKTAWAAGLALLDALERDRRRNVAGDAVIGAARAQAVTAVVFIGLVLTRKLTCVNFSSFHFRMLKTIC